MQRAGNFWFGDHASKAVGTQEQNVARIDADFIDIHFDLGVSAECAQKHTLYLTVFRLLGRDDTAAHLFRDEGMVVSELLERAPAQQIGAAITDVSDAQAAVIEPRGGKSGAHTVLLRIFLRGLINLAIRQVHGALQTLGFLRPVVAGSPGESNAGIVPCFGAVINDGFNGHGTGNFSMSLAAHTIGKDEEVERFKNPEGVLVVGAHTSYVRQAVTSDLHSRSFQAFREHAWHPLRGHTSKYRMVHASRGLAARKGFAPK